MNKSDISPTNLTRSHPRTIENFQLVWLDLHLNDDSEDTEDTINQLKRVISIVNTFDDVDKCIDFINDMKDEKAFLIISGVLGQHIMSSIHDMPQLYLIYVFCGSMSKHEEWAKQWPKVNGVYTQITSICDSLRELTQKFEQNWIPISFVTASEVADQNLDQLDQTFIYSQLLKEIIFELSYTEDSIKDLADYCRDKYSSNQHELKFIDKFEKRYRKSSPIWWYTYPCFIHSMLNRALRTYEVDTIIKMGLFIQDLHRQICDLHKDQFHEEEDKRPFTVYRGQGLTKVDFEKLIKAKGGLMSFNNFLSTSKKRKVSLEFSLDALNHIDMIGILYKMIIEPSVSSTPFSLIDDVSYFKSEQEILFSMHTVFRIGEIKQIENNKRLFQVELRLTSMKNQKILALIERLREETHGSTGWHRLGILLIKLGNYDKAEKVYKTLFDISTNDNEKALFYHQIGLIKRNQGDFRQALELYEKAIAICDKSSSNSQLDLATMYNNVGQVHKSIGDYDRALSFFRKSLDIYERCAPSCYESLAIANNNIGLILNFLGEYSQALEALEKALDIEQKCLPSNHPNIAMTYDNIGLIHKNMGNYSRALEFHEKALAIAQKTLPSIHPNLASSYNNLGLVYERLADYKQALSFYEKSLEIYQKVLPSNHPDLATLFNNIGSTYKNIGEYSKALLFYQKTLEIEQKSLPDNHPHLAITYSNIGTVYENIKDYAQALTSHEKALEIRQKTLPSMHRMLAMSFNNIGSLYDTLGNHVQALAYYEKTLSIEKEILPDNHPDLAISYNNIGVVYTNNGDFDTALVHHKKAFEIYEQTVPGNHPDLANSANNIACVYQHLNDYSNAIIFYEKALEIRKQILSSDHPDLATSYQSLWHSYQMIHDNEKAHSVYQQWLGISENKILPEPSDFIEPYKKIKQMLDGKESTSTITTFVKPIIKDLMIPMSSKRFRVKDFRTKLELKARAALKEPLN